MRRYFIYACFVMLVCNVAHAQTKGQQATTLEAKVPNWVSSMLGSV